MVRVCCLMGMPFTRWSSISSRRSRKRSSSVAGGQVSACAAINSMAGGKIVEQAAISTTALRSPAAAHSVYLAANTLDEKFDSSLVVEGAKRDALLGAQPQPLA